MEVNKESDSSSDIDTLHDACDGSEFSRELCEDVISALENHTSPLKRAEDDSSVVYLEDHEEITTYCRKIRKNETNLLQFAD